MVKDNGADRGSVVHTSYQLPTYIEADRIKNISPHILTYTQDQIEIGKLEIIKVQSEHNIVDMLTKVM